MKWSGQILGVFPWSYKPMNWRRVKEGKNSYKIHTMAPERGWNSGHEQTQKTAEPERQTETAH